MKAMVIEASSYCQSIGQSQLKKTWSTFQISIEGPEVTIDAIHQILLVSECIFLVVLCALTGAFEYKNAKSKNKEEKLNKDKEKTKKQEEEKMKKKVK